MIGYTRFKREGDQIMRKHIVSALGFAVIAASAASPAFAGLSASVPEPEVAGGLMALAAMGVGYRVLRNRFKR
jgi:small neutral amino acid transporter SnatA (MarC family)